MCYDSLVSPTLPLLNSCLGSFILCISFCLISKCFLPLSINLIYQNSYLSIHPFICLSIYLTFCFSIYLPVHPSIYDSLSLFLFSALDPCIFNIAFNFLRYLHGTSSRSSVFIYPHIKFFLFLDFF